MHQTWSTSHAFGVGIIFNKSYLKFSYVPESPRWLLGKGHSTEAKSIIENIAKRNGTLSKLPSHWELASEKGKLKGENKMNSFSDLFQYPYVIVVILIQIFSWYDVFIFL